MCTVPTGPPTALLCGSRGKMSRKKGIFQEKHSPQKKNVPKNATKLGETAAAEKECPGKRHNSGRKCCGGGETSLFWGSNREKMPPRRENVPGNPTKCGGNLSQQQNILILPPKRGGNHRAKENVLKIATKHGENLSQQQNILILPPKRGGNHRAKKNVPEIATIPGENVVAVGKHPCFGGKTGRKCRREGKMS